MPSALAAQLAKGVSLNAPLLSETARKKHFATSSYLFSASTKGQTDDLDTIHALALNALSQLKLVYPSIAAFDETSQVHRALFSQRAKETDRTLLAKDALEELNDAIKACLSALGPCLMETATGRIVEWLVRRFRVNEFNVPDVLALFLPYHESPHFAKMVSILTIEESEPWRFLAAYKAAGKSVQRSVLVSEMMKDRELTRFVVSLLPETLLVSSGSNTHRTLICFNTSVILEYVTRADRKILDAATLAFLLPSLTEPLKVADFAMSQALRKDTILGSYVLLAALSQKCTFTVPAVKAVMSGMVHCAAATSAVGAYQLLTALISFLGVQQPLERVPAKVVDEILALPACLDAVKASLEWSGVEKLLLPILGRLIENVTDESQASIQLIVSSRRTPETILKQLATKLLLKCEESNLLSELYQRHPDILRDAGKEIIAEDEEKKSEIDQTITSLAIPGGSGKAPRDILLASSHADPSVRSNAVRNIVELFTNASDSTSTIERSALEEALLARLYDTNASVLEALYSEPTALVTMFANAGNVLSKLASFLVEQNAPRAVLRAHLAFFCTAFVAAHPERTMDVALNLVLPNALFTKPRSRTAAAVWEAVTKSHLGEDSLFKGTKQIIDAGGEDMAATNGALAKILAGNFKVSNEYPTLLTWLLEKISERGDSHPRLLSLLILRALLADLSGENYVEAALKFLDTVDPTNLTDLDKLGDDENTLNEEAALKNVVLKPRSRIAMQRLQLMILDFIASAPHGQRKNFEWFLPRRTQTDEETIASRYVRLKRTVYAIVNTVSSNLTFVSRANHALFDNFGSDSLLFLAGIWTSASSKEGINWDTTKYIALRHASAFLRAQTKEEHSVDFQVLTPSILVSLQTPDRRIRAAAMECISTMAALTAGTKPVSIYAYDQIYGAASAGVQYLDWSDVAKYLNLLVERRDHLVNDAEYLVLLHYEQISRSSAENKKDTKHRRRTLCFLLSHALSCPSPTVRLSVLKSLRRVTDPVKLQMLLPFIEKSIGSVPTTSEENELVTYALEAFDSSAAKELSLDESRSWPVLLKAVQHYHGGDQWASICTTIQNSLFSALSPNRQLELSLRLIEIGSSTGDEGEIRRLLAHCITNSTLMKLLLESLQPSIKDTSERAFKKVKTDETSLQSAGDSLSQLTFLAEVLASQHLPSSLELVNTLLDTLSRVVASSSTPAQADSIYVGQILMSCIKSAASGIQELPNLAPSVIRVDVLVELMRTSENPQTFHQASLLLASLTRLSPASVLHNVMPIFTFMGSNVFHRDDSYSSKVIQKTIDSIVPAAISSLKEKSENVLDLLVAARDLLRTFTDASTHIPRHRRTSFFTHLVDVLGPAGYLAPILMLLADKSANRVSRQEKQEAQTTLALPLSVMQHYSPIIGLSALKEIIKEVQRLAVVIERPASEEKAFLEPTILEEHAVSLSTLRKRQCQTLLILTGFGMKQMAVSQLAKAPSDDLQSILTSLMELTTLDQNERASSDLREVGSSAQWALLQSMTVISATFFSSAILSMLASENRKNYRVAFSLLATRVPEMKKEARVEVSPVMAEIVKRMGELVPSFQDSVAVAEVMKALLSIGATSASQEESALMNMVPVVIDIIKKHPDLSQAIAVVPVLASRLGPRIIPYLRSLIDTCVSLVRSTDKTLNHESLADALRALTSLLRSMPSFWGTQEIKLVVELYLDEKLAAAKGISSDLERFIKLAAKQLPSRVVLSSLLQCWPPLEEISRPNGVGRYGRFFELLKRCLHFAGRPDVLEILRSLFNNFLKAFEVRGLLPSNDASSLEDKIIGAYLELVVKLNETAFQPLFRKSVDWAFGDTSSSSKQITFCRHYSALLDLFKELMTPYMSLLVNHFIELLTSFQNERSSDKELWLAAIETLSKSFAADDGVYWRNEKLRLVSNPLIAQISVCINSKISSGRTLLPECLTALVDCLEDDSVIKAANLAVLMQTRSEDARVRILALQCAVSVWQAHGGKLRGFGNEAATFIIECAEDENDDVVRACRQLKDAVEAQVGKIEGL